MNRNVFADIIEDVTASFRVMEALLLPCHAERLTWKTGNVDVNIGAILFDVTRLNIRIHPGGVVVG